MSDIIDKIKYYKNCKKELEEIKKEIDRQYQEFDKFMEPQNSYFDYKKSKLKSYNDENTISINLGELLESISIYTSTNKDDLQCIIFNNFSNMQFITKDVNTQVNVIIFSTNNKFKYDFKYNFKYNVDLINNLEDRKYFLDNYTVKESNKVDYLIGVQVNSMNTINPNKLNVKIDLEDLSNNIENQDILISILNSKVKEKEKKLGGKK